MRKARYILPGLFAFLFSILAMAQDENGRGQSGLREGQIEIIQDPRIDSLLKRNVSINESKGVIDGYRVQIFFASGTNSKKMANDTKAAFITKYPDVSAYVIYQAPNFKVRVGDYRTKMEASRFLREVKKDYPGAFIVKDEINLPEL